MITKEGYVPYIQPDKVFPASCIMSSTLLKLQKKDNINDIFLRTKKTEVR